MITGVCLNPCIDRTITIDSLKPGGLNRILSSRDDPAGKGYNVARAASRLGLRAAATGFLFNENGWIIADALAKDKVEDFCIHLPGSVRVNIKVYEKEKAIVTELNEKGNTIDAAAMSQLEDAIDSLSRKSAFMVFSGSVSPGMSTDIYRRLIEIARGNHCRSILDADGELLKSGISAKPFLIKPNLYELELLAGRKLAGNAEIKAVCAGLVKSGIENVVVSLGAQGAMLVDKKNALFAPALSVPVKSTVGAGDSMVAGLLLGLENKKSPEDILKLAMACAASSISREGTGLVNEQAVYRLVDSVSVTAI